MGGAGLAAEGYARTRRKTPSLRSRSVHGMSADAPKRVPAHGRLGKFSKKKKKLGEKEKGPMEYQKIKSE